MCEVTKCVKDAERVSKMKVKETSEVEEDAVSANESEGEVWDIICALDSNTEHKCMTESCEERAVATWSSNMKPNELWHTCEKHQELDFGGWPEDFDRPQTSNMKKDHDDESQDKDITCQDNSTDDKDGSEEPRETVDDENENNKEPEESTSKCNDKETKPQSACDNEHSTGIDEKSTINCVPEDNDKKEMSKGEKDKCEDEDEDEDEDDEQWDLSHVFTVDEMKSCKEPMCILVSTFTNVFGFSTENN